MNLLRLYMSQMESLLNDISAQLLRHAEPNHAHYFDTPRVTLDQEETFLEHGYREIPVMSLHGQDALTQCVQAYSDWYVYDEQFSRRYIHKHPGYVVVSCPYAFDRINSLVQELNDKKELFRQQVQKEGTHFEKWEAVHDRFRYIITMAVYRGIHCFDEKFDAVYFNWVTRKRSQKYSRQDLLEKLERSKAHVPVGRDARLWSLQVQEEIAVIESSHYNGFSSRRTINYRPEVNLRRDGKMQSVSAGLPIIVSSPPKKVTPLKTLDTAKRQRTRKSDMQWELLIPRMHLYADIQQVLGS